MSECTDCPVKGQRASPNELASRFCSGIDGLDVEFPAPGGSAFSDGEESKEERQEVEGVSNGDFSITLVYRGCFNDGLFSKDLQGGTEVFHVREARKRGGGVGGAKVETLVSILSSPGCWVAFFRGRGLQNNNTKNEKCFARLHQRKKTG